MIFIHFTTVNHMNRFHPLLFSEIIYISASIVYERQSGLAQQQKRKNRKNISFFVFTPDHDKENRLFAFELQPSPKIMKEAIIKSHPYIRTTIRVLGLCEKKITLKKHGTETNVCKTNPIKQSAVVSTFGGVNATRKTH